MLQVLRALVAGTLACFATACVAGAIYEDGEATGAGANASVVSSSTC
jgi:hypothetical protein